MSDAVADGGLSGGGDIDVARVLEDSPTLAGLPRAAREMLAQVMTTRRYEPGEALMEQGDVGDCMVVVADGVAQVSVTGDDSICRVLAQVGAGTVLGEMALLTKEPRSADVLAIVPVIGLILAADDFTDLCASYPDIAVVLTHLVAERLGQVRKDALGDKVLGGYRIKRRLGLGATAVVYQGENVETDETVALKMLSHRLAFDEVAIRRFVRELNIIERLRHENVARVYGRFEAFATHFMAMEFCDGLNLAELIERNGALPCDQVRGLLGQIGRALDHVHEHDVIHKDLKPANVMINRDGTVKLMDFGIASPPLDMTQDGDAERFFAGTPRYMAPEQFRMLDATPQVDVYALGCLGFEMLAGTAPFMLDSLGELVRAKTAGELEPLSQLRPEADADVVAFIERAMSVKAEDRPANLNAIHVWAAPCDPALVAAE